MEKQRVFPALALVGGGLCAVVRFLNVTTGFDETTGLVVSGDVTRLAVAGLLAVIALVSFGAGVAWMPKEQRTMGEAFYPDTLSLMLFVAGSLLMAVSGGLQAKTAFGTSQMELIVGALVAAGSVALLSQTAIFGKKTKKGPDSALFLVPVISVVLLLILDYRTMSINPVMGVYYVEILAYCAILMTLFQLFAFTAGMGKGRLFCPLATMGIVLSCATLTEGHLLSTNLFFVGVIALFLGGLLGYHPTK